MNSKFFALFFAAVLFCGCVQQQQGYQGNSFSLVEEGLVIKAIDGDTLLLQNGEKVRLIGIDSREKGEHCFEEAKGRMQQLVASKEVVMQKDASERDKYGRLVRYVYADGNFVNLKMVEEGLAFAFRFEPDTSLAYLFEAAELKARAENKGCLWTGQQTG